MDLPFLLALGRHESRKCLDQVIRVLALIPLGFLAHSQLLIFSCLSQKPAKLFLMVTLMGRSVIASLWDTWSIWRPAQLSLSLTVYSVILYNILSAFNSLINFSLLSGFTLVVLPLVAFSVLDSKLASIQLLRDSSLFTLPIYKKALHVVISAAELVFAQSIVPRVFHELECLDSTGFSQITVTAGGSTISSVPPEEQPFSSSYFCAGDLVTLASVLFWLSVQLMLSCRNSELLHATHSLGEWEPVPSPNKSQLIGTTAAAEPSEWSSGAAPYSRGALVTVGGVLYQAVDERNTSKPGFTSSVVNSTWKYVIARSQQITSWLIGTSLVTLIFARLIVNDKLSSAALICFSISAVVVHELSLQAPSKT